MALKDYITDAFADVGIVFSTIDPIANQCVSEAEILRTLADAITPTKWDGFITNLATRYLAGDRPELS